MKRKIQILAATLVLAPGISAFQATGALTYSALDDFDSYANGANIAGQGNGSVTWTAALGGGESATLSNTDSVTSPNSLRYASDATFGSVRATLAPFQAIPIINVGDSFLLRFHVRSEGDVESFAFRNLYSEDADGAFQTTLSNNIIYGISGAGGSGGNFFADNGAVQVTGLLANTWYTFELSVARGAGGSVDQSLSVFNLATGALLGTAPGGAANFSSRQYLTAVEIASSSATGTILFDNLLAQVIPEPSTVALFGIGALALRITRRRGVTLVQP